MSGAPGAARLAPRLMDTARYAELFLTESREHLSAVNHALLELERGGGSQSVDTLFRAVHTVKGMSATMGYTPVAVLSHEMETLLDRVRRGTRAVTPDVMDALFTAADALEAAVEGSVAGRVSTADVDVAVGRLRALDASSTGDAAASADSMHQSHIHDSVPRAGFAVSAPDGDGIVVLVRLVPETPLRSVRAFLIVQKLGTVGSVVATNPPIEGIQSESFGGEFAVRLRTDASAVELDLLVRKMGDVDDVVIVTALARENETVDPAAPLASDIPAPLPGEARVPVPAPATRQQRHIRIDLRRLDALMNLIGELVITRGRLTSLAVGLADPALEETVAQASRLISDLQDEIMTSRMVPVWQVFDRFPRLVRDAARTLEKEVEFAVEGKEIELDRSMLDEIGDPVVHLLRNAVDHGLETPAERVRAGKPSLGRLVLSAARDRSAVLIRVEDDGRGIDREKVLRRARDLGLVEPGRTELSDDELIRFISRSGFSTAERVSDISGRGVGIDAVQTRVRALGGSVDIRTAPGKGTAVTVRLPLTLAIVRALLARVGDETFALPMQHISETVEISSKTIATVQGREVLVLRDEVLPLLRLRDIVHMPSPSGDPGRQVVVLEVADRRAGLVVDELTGQQEIVVKQFDAVRDGLAVFGGATILGDGAPALIVDVSTLL